MLSALAASVLGRVLWINSPLQLLLDNGALFMLEMISYACAIFMVLHALGSPRRTMIVLGTIFVYHLVLLGLGRIDADVTITWYAQGMIMLGGGHLPLYLVVLHTLFYYVAYITTQRLHLQDYASACVFVVVVVGLNFPLELMGPKFIFWTFHDTEPTLKERFLSIPIAILLAHIASALSFYSTLWGAISLGLEGHVYHEEQAVAEHMYPIASILVSIPLSVFYFAMLFHLVCDLLLIQPQILLLALVALSIAIIWTCDRLGGDLGPPQIPPWVYDGEWTSAWYDHALVQAVFLYTGILVLLTLVINPTRLTSLSFHQRLGDCSIDTTYTTLLATRQTRAMYLCSKAYDEEFTFCNVPSSQLYTYEPWYAVCGRKYEHKAFPNYLVCMLVATTAIVLGLRAAYGVVRPTYVQRFMGPKA
ncbi:hypothetical protein SPRG_00757 [Saprolegnia parasitica CBS 223.65]|uniref:DUF7802 domain-containing protein n=1 Tax=Saprolegnia parasitica (strain CBS 223.65) TaxID=695850 RepID=A0A067CW48_SAPPC|nr:hypothetical protein SPRG_00757 [Saprolegnia parasitica CBS 223.65]KDO34693.1 hypothetical protein SPRG_00757 [Saprolegnia parasitica CBS 223.65]|eukprot:XP_012194365.1 hypothetical protein SPRG_00757 [Saprolegnia parasitica CBS 223.65]